MKKKPPTKKPVRSSPEAKQAEKMATQVEILSPLLEKLGLDELDVSQGAVRIRLRRTGATGGNYASAPPPPTVVTSAAPVDAHDGNVSYVTSPFVGTFYRASSPTAAPFVEVGAPIHKGEPLCIVEAMKLMNEIESEVDGIVIQCLAENGKSVEYGEPLFKIRER